MTAKKYDIVFKGKIKENANIDEVKQNISKLFKVNGSQLDHFFSGKSITIKKGAEPQIASRFKKAFENAGAVCHIVKQKNEDDEKYLLKTKDNKFRLKLIHPKFLPLGLASDQFSPIMANFVTAWDGGINLNRVDINEISYNEIELVSVFKYDKMIRLLMFIQGRTRPYLIHADKIRFAEFPGVKADSFLPSLKNFLHLIIKKNPNVVIDEATNNLFKDLPVFDIKDGLMQWATALALEKTNYIHNDYKTDQHAEIIIEKPDKIAEKKNDPVQSIIEKSEKAEESDESYGSSRSTGFGLGIFGAIPAAIVFAFVKYSCMTLGLGEEISIVIAAIVALPVWAIFG